MKCKNKNCKKKTLEGLEYCDDHRIIDYYYNPNVECTCEGLFADTHRNHCKRRVRPKLKGEELEK